MRNTSAPLVSIVVLNWNGLDDTKTCLKHLKNIDYPNYEIIVVDNGSRQDSKDYLRHKSGIIFVDNPVNRGFTGGHIDGLKHCSGEYIVLLNNDAVIKRDYIIRALEHFEDQNVAAVGGRSYFWNEDNKLLDESNRFYSYQEIDVWTGEARMLDYDNGSPQEVNNVSGSCVVVRKSVIDTIGYLYDPFFAYFEETDLFARMKRAGFVVLYDPALRIWHKNGASSGSSSGSHFFYYQIFRNRFMFATRNFEFRFMLKFWWIYAKITFVSFIKLLLGRGDRVMDRAYCIAAFRSLVTLPRVLNSRRQLTKQLGTSTYNHQIFGEQTGLSTVIDGTKLSPEKIRALAVTLAADNNPLNEYVIVTKQKATLAGVRPGIRVVQDKGLFNLNPYNIGCLAARFEWMALASPTALPDPHFLRSSVIQSLGKKISLIAFSLRSQRIASYLIIRKDLFQSMGGLGKPRTLGRLLPYLVQYAELGGLCLWQQAVSGGGGIRLPAMDQSTRSHVKKMQGHARHLARMRDHWLNKAKQMHYRIYQFVVFKRWIFQPQIPLRLKLARCKNLVLFTITLNMRKLAIEFQHIRNEVLVHDTYHSVVLTKRKIIKKRTAYFLANPHEIPVFIICRDRVTALRELVSWLEKHGLKRIVLIDNDSSYQPLLDYFEKTPHQVLPLQRNVGHTSPWKLDIIRTLVPEDFYIVTDPDVIPATECPDDAMTYMLSIHKKFFAYEKVGFGLKIDDLPDHFPLKAHVVEWESQFWKVKLKDKVYDAGVDTTFALYKPFTYYYALHPSIRTGEPYVARHLPWYHNPAKDTEEDIYYRFRADRGVNSWNTGELPERYKKEMTK